MSPPCVTATTITADALGDRRRDLAEEGRQPCPCLPRGIPLRDVVRIGGALLPHGHELYQGLPMEVAPVGPLSQTGVYLDGSVVDTQVTGMAESLV
jgi:hypothetical protein